MRMRISLGVVVLVALGFATITTARPQGEPPRGREEANRRARLRAEVARLRAEVELSQLEHEGDVAVLKDLINGVWMAEANAEMEQMAAPLSEELRKAAGGHPETDGLPFAKEVLARAGISLEADARKQALANKETTKLLRALYDQSKDRFLARTEALNEKKIDLEDLERRLSIAR